MQRQCGTGADLCGEAAGQGDNPTLWVVPVRVYLQNPIVGYMAEEFPQQTERAGNTYIGIAGRRTRINVKHTRVLSRPLHACVRAPHVHGDSPVRRRIRTDQKHFHR